MKTVTESIYSADGITIPMADVQHIEARAEGAIMVIMKSTRYDFAADEWSNPVFIRKEFAEPFKRAWCNYRAELEKETLMDLTK